MFTRKPTHSKKKWPRDATVEVLSILLPSCSRWSHCKELFDVFSKKIYILCAKRISGGGEFVLLTLEEILKIVLYI